MHEHHIVEGLVSEIIKKAGAMNASRVMKVTLVMGPYCGYQESSVRLYFESLSAGTILQGAELIVKPVKAGSSGTEFYVDSVEIDSVS